ncbi:MAG TPA: hypothetical protein VK992_05125 [Candidatus Caenarcaniphilales bacterium]|nr:hypothetical protein [Candidatus Caenarcaniphilales bacterium]
MPELINDPRSDLPGGGPSEDPQPAGGGDVIGRAGDVDAPIADRLGRDPGNLGGDVADQGDISYPGADPGRSQM